MNPKDFTGGLLLGASIGLVAGILLAPAKGSETVKKLSDAVKDNFNQLKDGAQDLVDDAKSKARDLADIGGNRAKEMLQDGKDKWAN